MLGTRGIWHNGWFAISVYPAAPSGWSHFAKDRWEEESWWSRRTRCRQATTSWELATPAREWLEGSHTPVGDATLYLDAERHLAAAFTRD